MSFSLDAYQAWRQGQEPDWLLREGQKEGGARQPKERLLQYIWQHQSLHRKSLQTLDGRQCQVLHPGFWNHGPGPDFTQGMIRLDGKEEIEGDIEIDCDCSGWRAHGHDRNQAFAGVILQVVWAPPNRAPSGRLVLPLEDAIQGSIEELSALFADQSPQLPEEFSGRCCAPFYGAPLETVRSLLRTAALQRFRNKASLLSARAREVGWRRSLWEAMVGGLGYSRNTWPMRCVGELTPVLFPEFPDQPLLAYSATEVEARLFGIAGFLPKDPNDIHSPYLNQMWDVWWRIRDEFSEVALPKNVWRISGMRPHNHPHRRLALVAQWLQRADFFHSLEWWITTATRGNSMEMLKNALSVIAPPFWSSRFNFSRVSLGVSPHLIGEARMIDLAINSILPWCWARAQAGSNQAMMDRSEALFLAMPRSEENRLLKNARVRLMGRCDPKLLGTAADQQGVLQVLRDFCAHSNALCDDCRLPELVRTVSGRKTV